jgi:hypothetical protein
MSIYAWQIQSLSTYPQELDRSDVVFQVNWVCTAIEDQVSATSVGSVPVTYTAGTPYTPYDQLTQEQVWGWINPSIDHPEIEANLQAMIDEQKTPTVVTPPLPWAAEEGTQP